MCDWLRTLSAHTYAECIMVEEHLKGQGTSVSEGSNVQTESKNVLSSSNEHENRKTVSEAVVKRVDENMKKEDVILIDDDR